MTYAIGAYLVIGLYVVYRTALLGHNLTPSELASIGLLWPFHAASIIGYMRHHLRNDKAEREAVAMDRIRAAVNAPAKNRDELLERIRDAQND